MKLTFSVAVAGPADAHATAQLLQKTSTKPALVSFQGMQPHVSYVWCGGAGPSLPADLMLCFGASVVSKPVAGDKTPAPSAPAAKAPAPAFNAIAVRHTARYADAVVVVAGGEGDRDGEGHQPFGAAWLRPHVFAARVAHAKCVVALLREGDKDTAVMTGAFERVCHAAGYEAGVNAFVLSAPATDLVADFVLRLRSDAADSALVGLRACLGERIHDKARLSSQPHYSLPAPPEGSSAAAGAAPRTTLLPTRASFIHRYRQGPAAALLYVVQGRLRVGDALASPALETSLAGGSARIASLHAFPHTAAAVPLAEAGAGEYVTVALEGSGPDDSGFFAGMDSGTLLGAEGPAARAAGLLCPPEMPFEVQVQGPPGKKGFAPTPTAAGGAKVPNAMACSHIITRDLDIQQSLWAARRPDPENPAACRLLFSEAPAQLLCSLDDDTGAVYYKKPLTEAEGVFGPRRFGLLVTTDGKGVPSFALVRLVVRAWRLDALRCAAGVVAAMPGAPLLAPRWHRSDRGTKTWHATITDPIARAAETGASLALVAAAPTTLLAGLGIVVAHSVRRVPAAKLSPVGVLTGFGGPAGEALAVAAVGLVFHDACVPITKAAIIHDGYTAYFSLIPFSTLYGSGAGRVKLPRPVSRRTVLITRNYFGDTRHRPAYPAEALRDSSGGYSGPLPDVYCRIVEDIQDNLYLVERDTVHDWRLRPEECIWHERNLQRAVLTAFNLPCPSFDKDPKPSRPCGTPGTSHYFADQYYLKMTPQHMRLAKILLDHFEVPRCAGLILNTLMRCYAGFWEARATAPTPEPDESTAMTAFLQLLAQRFRSLTLLHLPTLAPFLAFVDQCPETVRILNTNPLCDIWHAVQQRWARLGPEERQCPKRLAALASPFLSLFAADCRHSPPLDGYFGKVTTIVCRTRPYSAFIQYYNFFSKGAEGASELSLSALLEQLKSAKPVGFGSRFPLSVVVQRWAAVGVGNRNPSLDCSLSAVATVYLLAHVFHLRRRAAPPAVMRDIASFV